MTDRRPAPTPRSVPIALPLLAALLALPLSAPRPLPAPAGLAAQEAASALAETGLSGLELRGIGPAINGGRIADIDLHPEDPSVRYVAVGSGGVWKTENAGTTWTPIFDDQGSYSIGSVTLDPTNPSTVWVGTGENVGGRHVGFGDGIYRSDDGGATWENMGLEASEHLSTILVHPEDSDVVWVAAQGPLWSPGGDRGVYRTDDGGETWRKVLGDDEWTGATDLVMDPRDPDRLYAATWQRHRTVAAYMGGGPGSGIHRSEDGGETWEELTNGLPTSNLGKIGLAISPQEPDRVYAAIELDRRSGGVFMSTDRGASWRKMSDAVSGGTGPHYYQELYASPHEFGRLFLVSVRTLTSTDHGATFEPINVRNKHVDDHAIAFRPDDPDYLMIGTDGGLYETFDLMETWRFVDNLPVMQYYKVAVDDAEPFYHVYGGTQDNGSNAGPSRTDTEHGIRNADWWKTLGADGHDQATEPGSGIHYGEYQQGVLFRIDRSTGEAVPIQPQAGEGEDFERFNWDAPVEVSFHDPARIYHASQRVWRSDDRGDSWTPISGDLTRDQERVELEIMGRQRSWDNPWDVSAMSNYNTITSLGESPLDEELIWAGTDDGLLQVTEDGGESWREIEVGSLPGVPPTAFVNDIKADHHDVNTVYVALDDHKNGDFSPYLLKSTDRGRSWTSIAGDLPDRHLVWRVVQDHVDPELLFAATEFGLFFTLDGGGSWTELPGAPTIAFRDVVIQRDHEDVAAASFGRGMFILDDYGPLREMDADALDREGALFTPRTADWYAPRDISDSQGDGAYRAENPPFGAVFTYHLRDGYETLEAERREREEQLAEGQDVPFPGWDALEAEMREQGPAVQVLVRDTAGTVIERVDGSTSAGVHRVAWDLRHSPKNVVGLEEEGGGFFQSGFPALPGRYTATLVAVEEGELIELDGPVEFDVEPLREGALPRASDQVVAEFRTEVEAFQRALTRASDALEEHVQRVEAMQSALERAERDDPELAARLYEVRQELLDLRERLRGSEAKDEIGERGPPTPFGRLFVGMRGLNTTYGPTELHRRTVEAGRAELAPIREEVERFGERVIPELERALEAAGAPPVEG